MNRNPSPLLAAALLLAACSRSEPSKQAAAEGNASARRALQEAANEQPPAPHAAPAGAVERLEVYPLLKTPSTPGNPHSFSVCVALYDGQGRPVAAEGDFTVRSELTSGGMYVYPPMYSPMSLPTGEIPAAICPAGGTIWPQALEAWRGKVATIEVTFKGQGGATVSGNGFQTF